MDCRPVVELDSESSPHFLSGLLAKECVSDSHISYAFIVDKLRESCASFKERLHAGEKIANLTCTDIGGTGNSWRIVKCSMELTSTLMPGGDGGDLEEKRSCPTASITTIKLILKIMIGETRLIECLAKLGTIDDESTLARDQTHLAAAMRRFRECHNRECNFYAQFDCEEVNGGGVLPLAKTYYVQRVLLDSKEDSCESSLSQASVGEGGLIMMEDLTPSTYLVSPEEGLNVAKVTAVVRHLAAFHANLLGAMSDEQRNHLLAPFREICPLPEVPGEASIAIGLRNCAELVPAMEEPIRKLRRTIDRDFCTYCFRDRIKQLGIPAVLIHGDMWNNNLLWKLGGEGEHTDELAAFIDWQLTCVANPMLDVARILVTFGTELHHASGQAGPQMVQLYYDELNRRLEEIAGKGKELSIGGGEVRSTRTAPYTLDFTVADLMEAYELALAHSTMVIAVFVPLIQKALCVSEGGRAVFERFIDNLAVTTRDAVAILERIGPEWLAE